MNPDPVPPVRPLLTHVIADEPLRREAGIRADIHELLCSDLLHQTIKGTFKDHLVTWVGDYLELVHGPTRAAAIMADIDRR